MPATIHKKPIAERLQWLRQLSANHSRDFCSPESYLNRVRYKAKHPTHLMAFKCMDGRIHLPHITKTPRGIIQPFRNLGGAFDLGWPYLGEIMANSVMRAVGEGRRVLILVTYHFSRGDRIRGCAGFGYDTARAVGSAFDFMRQVEGVFGADQRVVCPIVVGVETDDDALIFHGRNGEALDLSDFSTDDEGSLNDRLRHAIGSTYPGMPPEIAADLLPLALGNLKHIAEVRREERALDIEHREWVLCVGRGFDFLHVPNTALIVGPYSPNIAEPIAQAAGIIKSNMQEGRIPDDGMVLLASSPFYEIGVDYRRAVEKSRFLCRFSAETIKREVPFIHERMIRRTCVLNWETREMEEIEIAMP